MIYSQSTTYANFLVGKSPRGAPLGIQADVSPSYLYDFQSLLLDWSVEKGCAAILADADWANLRSSFAWAQNIIEATNKPVLHRDTTRRIVADLARVEKFSIQAYPITRRTPALGAAGHHYQLRAAAPLPTV